MSNKPKIYMDKKWISGDTCIFTIKDVVEHAMARRDIGNLRRDFVKKLEKEGFEIITDPNNITDDTICFTFYENAFLGFESTVEEFKKEFDRRIFKAGGDKLYYPKSVEAKEYLENPFYPAVFKNELTNAGKDKFLIENEEQLVLVKKFFDDYKNNSKYSGILTSSVCQQYIKTPTQYKTYLRVLMGLSGVMGASIKYSHMIGNNSDFGELDKYFCDPESKYYLNCERMFGYYSGDGNISLFQPKYSTEKRNILLEHNIDPDNPSVPSDVLEVCNNIMIKCNREVGILCGIDFIPNEEDGKWYYLENQAFPAVNEWADKNKVKLPHRGRGVKGYLEHMKVDLDARYDALMGCTYKDDDDNICFKKTIFK